MNLFSFLQYETNFDLFYLMSVIAVLIVFHSNSNIAFLHLRKGYFKSEKYPLKCLFISKLICFSLLTVFSHKIFRSSKLFIEHHSRVTHCTVPQTEYQHLILQSLKSRMYMLCSSDRSSGGKLN